MDLFRCAAADMRAGMKDAMAMLHLVDPAHLIEIAFWLGLENDVIGGPPFFGSRNKSGGSLVLRCWAGPSRPVLHADPHGDP